MKKLIVVVLPLLVLIAAAWMLASYERSRQSAWNRIKNPQTVQTLKHFVAMKKAQAYASTSVLPPEIRGMFKYAERGDWLELSNSFQTLQDRIAYWNSLGYGVRRSNDYSGALEDLISDLSKKVGTPLPWDYWAPPRLQDTAGEGNQGSLRCFRCVYGGR